MEETQKYLNSILEKRMGSVVNNSSYSRNGQTVARIAKKEEKIQTMPTVFRKKHETVYRPESEKMSVYSQSQKLVQKDKEQEKPTTNQRVEYMAISKRIEQKKEQNVKMPTVDVSKYRQTQFKVIEEVNQSEEMMKSNSESHQRPSNKTIIRQSLTGREASEQSNSETTRPKRRKIFSKMQE